MELLLATGNLHKKREMEEILSPHTIIVPSQIGLPFYYEETGTTYFENSYGKAEHLFRQSGRPVIADDSGLSVPSLGGEPGIHSARYGSVDGHQKLDDAKRNHYLLEKMKTVTDRRAFFVCCMVLILEEFRFFVAQETVEGVVTTEPMGTGGFGYDPLFFLPDYGKTAAELPEEEKNAISHRGKAGKQIQRILTTF